MCRLYFILGDIISLSDCTGNFKRSRLKEAMFIYLIAAGTGKDCL